MGVRKLHARSSAMAMNPAVRIEPRYTRYPTAQVKYNLICHFHRVDVMVTSKPAVVKRWISFTRYLNRFSPGRRLVVGLGVQWTPRSGAATLQLCVGYRCLIFQLLHAVDSPASLRRFLSDPNISFVAVGNYREIFGTLSDSYHRLPVPPLVDLRRPANYFWGCRLNASMETLASRILGWTGMAREAAVRRSDWDVNRLSEEQVKFASLNAFLARLIGNRVAVWRYY